ncbi:MAG TPA: c-type cytochrome [Vicinamibacterales bacterium]|nr:c-type cytochrome [Vicinamibacterales bacterium]
MRVGLVAAVLSALFAATACGRQTPPEQAATAPPKRVFTPRPLRDITVARTPERVARGKYLSEGLLQCFVCHSERDWTKPGAPPMAATKGAGVVWPGRPWLVAPNLTPDRETGIGRWTDDMLLRAIREGISHDGRVLHKQMWYSAFRALPDDDAEAIVAYLRSLKPIRRPLPATAIPAEEASKLTVPEPLTLPVVRAPATEPIQRGSRLAGLADCAGCHTSWYTPRNPGLFGGGNLIGRGDHQRYSPNLTSDPSGIPHYDEAFFREVMRTGRAKGRELDGLMPWTVFRNLNDDDLNALFAYLRALPPVKHVIDNIDAPTKCAICGGTHPLGQYNQPAPRTLVAFDAGELETAAGTYRFENSYELTISIDRGKLWIGSDPADRCELVTEDRRTFYCDGDIDRIQFLRGANGAVTAIINMNTERGEKIK